MTQRRQQSDPRGLATETVAGVSRLAASLTPRRLMYRGGTHDVAECRPSTHRATRRTLRGTVAAQCRTRGAPVGVAQRRRRPRPRLAAAVAQPDGLAAADGGPFEATRPFLVRRQPDVPCQPAGRERVRLRPGADVGGARSSDGAAEPDAVGGDGRCDDPAGGPAGLHVEELGEVAGDFEHEVRGGASTAWGCGPGGRSAGPGRPSSPGRRAGAARRYGLRTKRSAARASTPQGSRPGGRRR